MTATLYGDLLAAGVPMDNHESDLYFQDTPASRAILARFPDKAKLARPFWSALDSDQKWWDVPFAFLPWWERRCAAEAMRAGEIACDIINPGDLRE
jgi:hypothetical protein